MPTQALLEKKEEIKIRKSFQKTMSIVNEDVEKEDSAKEDIQQIISEESFEKPEPNNEKSIISNTIWMNLIK